MKRHTILVAAIAAACIAPVSAFADENEKAMVLGSREASSEIGWAKSPPPLESIRYRPRTRTRYRDDGYVRGSRSTGFGQIHGGVFDPEGNLASGSVFGFRAGASLENNIQVGVGADWNHRSDRQSVVVGEVTIPGGGTAERHRDLARSSSNLFPMLAFLQVSPGQGMQVKPYIGIGGGYEVLFLSADLANGDNFDATFDGWGWQAWAGLAMPLGGRTNLAAEVFLNNADLSRDVDDPTSGERLRETMTMNGVGLRAGLNWGF